MSSLAVPALRVEQSEGARHILEFIELYDEKKGPNRIDKYSKENQFIRYMATMVGMAVEAGEYDLTFTTIHLQKGETAKIATDNFIRALKKDFPNKGIFYVGVFTNKPFTITKDGKEIRPHVHLVHTGLGTDKDSYNTINRIWTKRNKQKRNAHDSRFVFFIENLTGYLISNRNLKSKPATLSASIEVKSRVNDICRVGPVWLKKYFDPLLMQLKAVTVPDRPVDRKRIEIEIDNFEKHRRATYGSRMMKLPKKTKMNIVRSNTGYPYYP